MAVSLDWTRISALHRFCLSAGHCFFFNLYNKGKVLTAKKISWKEIRDNHIKGESLGPQRCDDHG